MFLTGRDNQLLPGVGLGSCVAGCDQVIPESSQVRVMGLYFSSEAKILKRNSNGHPSPSEAHVLTCHSQILLCKLSWNGDGYASSLRRVHSLLGELHRYFVCAQLVSSAIPDPGKTERLKALQLHTVPDISLLTSWPRTSQPCFGAGSLVIAGNSKAGGSVCICSPPVESEEL